MVALYVGGMGARGKNFYNDLVAALRLRGRGHGDPGPLPRRQEGTRPRPRCPPSCSSSRNLVGPEGYIKERLAASKEAGVTVLNVTPIGPDPAEIVEKLKAWSE